MIIINADDFGRTRTETDVAVACYNAGSITSATAMVFMADSERAAEVAQESAIDLGLHLNLSQPFTGQVKSRMLLDYHDRIVRFITSTRYSRCIYNPALRRQFQYTYQTQFDEFMRLYGRKPSHVDGHHHTHLCTNILLDKIIPPKEKVRRSFSFKPGDKNIFNRAYRRAVDSVLVRNYKSTDFFFLWQTACNTIAWRTSLNFQRLRLSNS